MRKAAVPSILIGVVLLALGGIAEAQQIRKIHRVGMLFFGSREQPHLASFQRGLRDLGYVEGKNIVIDYRYAEGSVDRNRMHHVSKPLASASATLIFNFIESKKSVSYMAWR